jgi:hypothetical protein
VGSHNAIFQAVRNRHTLLAARLISDHADGLLIAYDIKNGEQLRSIKLTEPDGRPATIAASRRRR